MNEENKNLDKMAGADEETVSHYKEIELAEKAGLVFTGDYNDDGEPEFIGTAQQWDNFRK